MTATETDRDVSKYTGPKRRIGVVDFDNKTAYGQRLGTAASDILVTELAKLGARIEERPDGFRVEGTGGRPLRGARVSSWGDHRLAMALVVAGIRMSRGEDIYGRKK